LKSIVIIDAIRTPVGKYKGKLSEKNAIELATAVSTALINRNIQVEDDIEQAIFGNVLQAGSGQNPARQIALKSGLSAQTSATTINQVCGSGMKAVLLAAQAIQLGQAKVVLAGGTENMSQAQNVVEDALTDAFECMHMGKTAEYVAQKYGITRTQQDQYAQNSQEKAAKAQAEGLFKAEILEMPQLDKDESIRASSSIEKLSSLQPAFEEKGTVTAGNASPINDGAAALLLSSQEYADKKELPILAIIKDFVEIGVEPLLMSISPIKAIAQLLDKNQLTIEDIDLFEINEAFAVSSIIINKELHIPQEKVNIHGGSIALGHAIGATGARILTSLSYQLKLYKKRYGIASLCIGGGLGLAVLLENPNYTKEETVPSKKFYQMSPKERLRKIAEKLQIAASTVTQLENQALDASTANSMIENQISEIELPMGLGLNLKVNDKEYSVPMATEEPSVIAAMSNGAKMAGEFQASVLDRLMNGQIVFYEVNNPQQIVEKIEKQKEEIFTCANDAYPSIVKRGGGLREVTSRVFDETGFLSVDFKVDVKDAMGANIVNTILEKVAQLFSGWFDEGILFSILSNYSLNSRVKVTCALPFERVKGEEIAKKIAMASDFAHLDPYRAATHNKGIMNGVEAVVLATGNDTRAVSASVHAFASRNGTYQSLSKWSIKDSQLVGEIEIPLAIASKGGATNVLPKAKAALEILDIESATELAQVMAAVGLSSNLAALRALVSEGIQKGHMGLQVKSLAMSVGAKDQEIEQLSSLLKQEKTMNQATARKLLTKVRGQV